MRQFSKIYLKAVAIILVAGGLGACGGRQSQPVEEEREVETGSCVSERWAAPPAQVGETPPDRIATDEAVDPFNYERGRTLPDDDQAPEPGED